MLLSRALGGSRGVACPAQRAARRGARRAGALAQAQAKGGFGGAKTGSDGDEAAEAPSLEGVKVVKTPKENCRVELAVNVPAEMHAYLYEGIITELGRTVKIDGFRKGKPPPKRIIIGEVGEEEVRDRVVEAVLRHTIATAMGAVAAEAIQDSEAIMTPKETLLAQADGEGDFEYVVSCDINPSLEWASEQVYKGIRVKAPEPRSEEVLTADAEAELQTKRRELGVLRVREGELTQGDVAIVDFQSFHLKEDGSLGDPIMAVQGKAYNLDTEQAKTLLPGFVDGLLGNPAGEAIEYEIKFPEDWAQANLRGKKALVKARMTEIFDRDLPELDNELVARMFPDQGWADVAACRKGLLEAKVQQAAEADELEIQQQLLDKLAELVVSDVPRTLVEQQGREQYAGRLLEMQAAGTIGQEALVQLSDNALVNNYVAGKRDEIRAKVRQAMAVTDIFTREKLEYDPKRLEAEIANAEDEFRRYGQDYDPERVREQTLELLQAEQVLAFLRENAVVE